MKTSRKEFHLIFLFTFFFITLFINFFHTEDFIPVYSNSSPDSNHPAPEKKPFGDDCPACHFLNSTFTTNQINFFVLPPPICTGLLESAYSYVSTPNTVIIRASRSPPSA